MSKEIVDIFIVYLASKKSTFSLDTLYDDYFIRQKGFSLKYKNNEFIFKMTKSEPFFVRVYKNETKKDKLKKIPDF